VEGPGNSEDTTTMATSQVERLDIEENVEGRNHTGAPQENAEVDVESKGDEV
jgi:hypothetical protein